MARHLLSVLDRTNMGYSLLENTLFVTEIIPWQKQNIIRHGFVTVISWNQAGQTFLFGSTLWHGFVTGKNIIRHALDIRNNSVTYTVQESNNQYLLSRSHHGRFPNLKFVYYEQYSVIIPWQNIWIVFFGDQYCFFLFNIKGIYKS